MQVKVKISEFSPLLLLALTRIPKIDFFFIVSDVMENGTTNIKTNTAQFIAIKYSDTEKLSKTLQRREF